MNTILLEEAIRARLLASLATQSVDNQGVWSTIAPPGIEIGEGLDPLVVFTLQVGTDDDSQNKQAIQAVYRVDIWDHRKNVDGDGNLPAADVYAAVYGDGTPTNASTYGLQRWRPTVSGATLSQMRRLQFGADHQDDILNWWITFEVIQEEA
jgi:hypothetical protein